MKIKTMLTILLIGMLLAACASAPQTTNAPDVDDIVAQTFAAMTAQAATVTEAPATLTVVPPTDTPAVTPTPVPGSISGTLSYPSSFLPPMRVAAFQVNGFNYRYVDTMEGQSTFQITELPPGKYHVAAYSMDGSLAGGFTLAVACGLSVDCADHSLIDVVVVSGQDTPNINPQDWYAPAGSFPAKP
jgi:hypothetical protein